MFIAENIFPLLKNTYYIILYIITYFIIHNYIIYFIFMENAKFQSNILPKFIRINPRGVIFKIKTTQHIVDICKM